MMGQPRVTTAPRDWLMFTLGRPIILCVRYFRRSAIRLMSWFKYPVAAQHQNLGGGGQKVKMHVRPQKDDIFAIFVPKSSNLV